MDYGFNISASGIIANMFRQDVLTNNLANANTVGFKPDSVKTVARDDARAEDNLYHLPSNVLLEELASGVLLSPVKTAFEQGGLDRTENPLDLALEGDGFFAVSKGPVGDPESVRVTRAGSFTLNSQGVLVTQQGYPVLDQNMREITLDPTLAVDVSADGSVSQGGGVVSQLAVLKPDDDTLRKDGDTLFRAKEGAIDAGALGSARVHQGFLERSSVDPIQALFGVTKASGAASSNTRMARYFDELLNRAINTFGNVSG